MSDALVTDSVARALSVESLERVSRDEPTWLKERRSHAWSVYEATPMPTTKLEEWRYTDLSKKLDLETLSLSEAETAPDDPSAWPARLRATMDEDHAASGHIVFIDGHVVHADLDSDLASQGVVLKSLHEAVDSHAELVQEHLATEALPPEEGKFASLNAALWVDGIFLFVPKGVQLELPIRVTRWLSEAGTAYMSRVLIVAENHSQVSYVDEVVSNDFTTQMFTSTAAEVIAKDGAQVQFVSVQRLGRGSFYHSVQRTLANRDATLDTLNVGLGASVSRVDLNAKLLGPGATSDMLGLYFGDGSQHFDFNTSQDHTVPNTSSDLLYKGALDGASRSVFRGIIRVHEGAQRTDAYQTNRNLLLSNDARADSLPNLEIEADDVKCSHGATVGELDADAKFYLMSRGLDRVQAERLVVLGFLGEVLARLPLGGVGEKVTRVIEEKLAQHV
ncbi:MAG: Fe-S cluster assembly protein SufD [Gemmatimonadetes bacterium]|nr:Fe-S cluster assembly protein SufD [Gemmatimonadota bacterium]MEE2904893.1 Fe-S cluster assembly protein SufD [Gemmatimonadota bacterium]